MIAPMKRHIPMPRRELTRPPQTEQGSLISVTFPLLSTADQFSGGQRDGSGRQVLAIVGPSGSGSRPSCGP